MGNAVKTLFQKKIEARQKQAEKEREIYQACLALTIEQEERKKKEASEKQEKIRKEKEIKRIKRDHDLMESYLKNIEKETNREHEEWKRRDKEMVKRKREVYSAHERRIRKQEEHIKHEAEIISKNIAMIEKKSIQSRQEMKARIASMAQKRKNDNKEFLKKTHTAQHDRKKEIENNKRRIRFIEKRIVEDRIEWQQKLMSARGIQTEAKISTQKLWSIGRQKVEKRKNKENLKSDKTLSKKSLDKDSTTVRKTLSSVEEEEIAVLDDEEAQITQIAIAQTSRNAGISTGDNTKKGLDISIIKHADSKLFQQFYVPQKGATSSQGQITIRSGSDGEILNRPKNTHSTPRTAARDKIFAPSDSSRSLRKTEIPGNRTTEKEDKKSQGQVMTKNLNNDGKVENKTRTGSSRGVGTEIKGSQENTKVFKKQKSKDDSSREKSYTGVNNLTQETSPRRDLNPAQTKQEDKQPKRIVGKRHETQERKRIVTMSDPLMPKSLSLKQLEVENIIGIKPLSSSKDTAASTKNVAIETKTQLSELTPEIKELTGDKGEVKKAEINTKLSPRTHNHSTYSQDNDYNFVFLTVRPNDAMDSPKVTFKSTTEVNNKQLESTAVAPRTRKIKDVIGFKTPNVIAKNGSTYTGRTTGNRDSYFKSVDTDRDNASSCLISLKEKEKQGAFTTETKTEKKIRTIQVNPMPRIPSNAGVFVVDQNISEVQRRIDHMVKLHTNDIPVV